MAKKKKTIVVKIKTDKGKVGRNTYHKPTARIKSKHQKRLDSLLRGIDRLIDEYDLN